MFLLHEKLDGFPLPEAPISTMDGVRAADVAWYSNERFSEVKGQIAFERAPEICVEVISPRNTKAEMLKKKRLYFDAGSDEVWFCELDGTMRFFLSAAADEEADRSSICADFPTGIE